MPTAPPPEGISPAASGERWTLLDLAALIVGVAVVLVLPWVNRPESLARMAGHPWWSKAAFRVDLATEAAGKLALVLVPVALARAAQRGRMVRPAEFLLACLGLPWLAQGIHDSMLRVWLRARGWTVPGEILPADDRIWSQQTTWRFHLGWLAIAAAAGLVLVVGRRRLRGWVASAVLMAGWLGLHECLVRHRWYRVAGWLFAPIRPANPVAAEVQAWFLQTAPFFALFSIPLAMALLGPRDGTPVRRAGLDWLGLALSIASIVAYGAVRVIIDMLGKNTPTLMDVLGLLVPALLAAGLGVLVAFRLRRGRNPKDGLAPAAP